MYSNVSYFELFALKLQISVKKLKIFHVKYILILITFMVCPSTFLKLGIIYILVGKNIDFFYLHSIVLLLYSIVIYGTN